MLQDCQTSFVSGYLVTYEQEEEGLSLVSSTQRPNADSNFQNDLYFACILASKSSEWSLAAIWDSSACDILNTPGGWVLHHLVHWSS